MKAVLIWKDGTILYGKGFGAQTTQIGELVFNTSMIGYQEALTDPSYAGQILTMSYPLIGNYGINEKEYESKAVHVEGYVVREASSEGEHRESFENLDAFLKEFNVPGIEGIDTRYIVRKLRTGGVMPALLATYENSMDVKKLREELEKFDYGNVDFVEKVTRKTPETYGKGRTVVLIDLGVKMGIVRELVERNVRVVVLPSFASLEEIERYEPAGIVISNGPGDPGILTGIHALIRKLAEKDYPLMGICLGHQVLAHAFGGKTFKLKFGHRGSNHPVLDKLQNKIAITTQNHGYAVDKALPKNFELTHVNVNDGTVEGMQHADKPVFSVQYHPESSPGPRDSKYLFDEFLKML
ncbi:MAG TPA: glutamine-hydrolyzing carbamoyl-phosphate synthase small subunit [Candidatus Bilamarchaeaceae archaeon]|nr:glutamine-hydrolyzing carbamoyl-phosphate synthase small subunit [Candidatus Bilamarchaeaceae archaeon]